jgi:hypothetical protein
MKHRSEYKTRNYTLGYNSDENKGERVKIGFQPPEKKTGMLTNNWQIRVSPPHN